MWSWTKYNTNANYRSLKNKRRKIKKKKEKKTFI